MAEADTIDSGTYAGTIESGARRGFNIGGTALYRYYLSTNYTSDICGCQGSPLVVSTDFTGITKVIVGAGGHGGTSCVVTTLGTVPASHVLDDLPFSNVKGKTCNSCHGNDRWHYLEWPLWSVEEDSSSCKSEIGSYSSSSPLLATPRDLSMDPVTAVPSSGWSGGQWEPVLVQWPLWNLWVFLPVSRVYSRCSYSVALERRVTFPLCSTCFGLQYWAPRASSQGPCR